MGILGKRHRTRSSDAISSNRLLLLLLLSRFSLSDSVRPHRRQPPGFPSPGILQARTLEWVAISFSNAWKWKVKVKSLSHVWLSDPKDCSLPSSSIHGIFQASVLEWGAIAFSGKWLGNLNILYWLSMISRNWGWKENLITRRHRKFSGVMEMFYVLKNYESHFYCDPYSQRLWHSQ